MFSYSREWEIKYMYQSLENYMHSKQFEADPCFADGSDKMSYHRYFLSIFVIAPHNTYYIPQEV